MNPLLSGTHGIIATSSPLISCFGLRSHGTPPAPSGHRLSPHALPDSLASPSFMRLSPTPRVPDGTSLACPSGVSGRPNRSPRIYCNSGARVCAGVAPRALAGAPFKTDPQIGKHHCRLTRRPSLSNMMATAKPLPTAGAAIRSYDTESGKLVQTEDGPASAETRCPATEGARLPIEMGLDRGTPEASVGPPEVRGQGAMWPL